MVKRGSLSSKSGFTLIEFVSASALLLILSGSILCMLGVWAKDRELLGSQTHSELDSVFKLVAEDLRVSKGYIQEENGVTLYHIGSKDEFLGIQLLKIRYRVIESQRHSVLIREERVINSNHNQKNNREIVLLGIEEFSLTPGEFENDQELTPEEIIAQLDQKPKKVRKHQPLPRKITLKLKPKGFQAVYRTQVM